MKNAADVSRFLYLAFTCTCLYPHCISFHTTQVGEYGLHNTPAGMKQIIDAAVKVCPALADLAIEKTWAGLRPVTPDLLPVLGASPRCPNLFVAGGYWRNGVLLAPKTAQLVADAVCGSLSVQDETFSREFSLDRFFVPGTAAERQAPALRESTPAERSTVPASKGGFLSEASPSEVLDMERAALEGMNDGSLLSGLEGLLAEQSGADAEVGTQVSYRRNEYCRWRSWHGGVTCSTYYCRPHCCSKHLLVLE